MKYKRLGDMLLSVDLITEEQLNEALAKQKESKDRLGKVLVDNGYITESQLIETLRMQLGIDFIDLTKVDIPPEMSSYVPKHIARKDNIVPVKLVKDTLFMAMADPMNFMAIEEARKTSKKRIVPMIASSTAVDHAINTLYGNEGAAEAMAQMRAEAGIRQDEAEEINEGNANAPTIRLVNSIVERAYTEKASDIHFEPSSGDMNVRMRIDGRLHNILKIPGDLKDPVISRLKVMGHLDIVERRIPQDGRAEMKLKSKDIDMRMSTLPTIYGEKVVIRLLARDENMLDRRGIGIMDADSDKLDKMMANTSGVILIVGPTGSGKSSTMYTLIKELLNESTNLITLEDPVEYNIDGATQVQINEKTGLTFASGLRAILRQDPDIICVGEIRDGETAEIAMRAAMTGHLVISTIHTEDAVSAIDRLHDMGVEPYLIAGGLRGIISQRLVRVICKNCKEEYEPDKEKLKMAGIDDVPGRKYYHGSGCDMCFHSGYRGRTGVFEFLPVNDKLRKCINDGANKQEIKQIIGESGFVTMQQNAEALVSEGVTTVEEVCRTLGMVE
ncbi:GspE/PulE family protein [Aminicella lysinilytica]|uniref:Type IV pilus assembly protein PilB n=1 Tax=Aminicella lysinilytica TaxID=433323 RepID=A0A4R6QA10_9FIRM|nr:GspE/PulE family protein [Aminicella lysinilytica]TDP58059.1 type IV pilus assembly protein PilB [Aminicella lysinilytica]